MESFTMIPNSIGNNLEYYKFALSYEKVLLEFLIFKVLRNPKKLNNISADIATEYYLKQNKLVACYSVDSIAKYTGVHRTTVHKSIKKLSDMGFIIIHKKRLGKSFVNIYEVGYYTGKKGKNHVEYFYCFEYFLNKKEPKKPTSNTEKLEPEKEPKTEESYYYNTEDDYMKKSIESVKNKLSQ